MTGSVPTARRTMASLLVGALTLSLLALLPPAPARAAQLSTDFSGNTPGAAPTGWTSLWQPAWFAVDTNPTRLVQAPAQTARSLLAWDAPGDLTGVDVEVSTLLQVPEENWPAAAGARFQLHLNATGSAGAETSYFLEVGGNNEVRIGQFDNGAQTTNLETAAFPGGLTRYTWYHFTFGREGNTLRAKIWPYGSAEPGPWLLEHTPASPLPNAGRVGIGSRNAGTNPAFSDYAWFGVGTGPDPAPRAPDGLVPIATAPTEPVQGVSVEHHAGFTTVRWDAYAGSPALQTEYWIYRVPVEADNTPTGPEEHVGVWRPNRYTYNNPDALTFADAGYLAGERFGWAVRARNGAGQGPLSGWVYGDTLRAFTPSESYRTGFETNIATSTTGSADWTLYEQELDFTNRVVRNSDRVRVEVAGRSHLGRDILLWVVSDEPPASPEDNDKPVVLLNCVVHGGEAAGREACMMLVRELAFSDDPWVTDILETSTVLIVPAINRDGTHARPQTRGNAHNNQDLNRDHSLLREPETLALSRVIRDWRPGVAIDGHHYGQNETSDLPLLWPRNWMVDEELAALTQDEYILGHLFGNAAQDGWWAAPYPIGYSEETILRNTLGLKNVTGVLLESRSSGGPTRPAEGTQVANRQRHVYSHLWTYRQVLDFHHENHERVAEVAAAAEARNIANEGALVLDGARPTPRRSPPDRPTTPSAIIETPPCGYLITEAQYTERQPYSAGYEHFGLMPSAETRLAGHGIDAYRLDDGGVFIPLGQRLRGLIALLLDPNAAGQDNLPGSYEGPFLYSGQAQRVATCPELPGGPEDPDDPDDPDPDPDPQDAVVRLSGAGRVQTAIEVSRAGYGDGEAAAVVLARADLYPDALAGTPLAVAVDGPLLVTSSNVLLDDVVDEIQRVLPDGGTVHLLGGVAALDDSVAARLTELRYEVDRIAGTTRIETAVAVAERLGDVDDILVTTGFDFPDALTAGTAAAAINGAVVLTTADAAHPAVDAYLLSQSTATVHAVGGPASRAYPAAAPVFGSNRDRTAIAVAEAFFDGPEAVGIARNDDFPDAMSGGAHMGRVGGPILLTTTSRLSGPAAQYLEESDTVSSVLVFGGTSAVADAVIDEITAILDD